MASWKVDTFVCVRTATKKTKPSGSDVTGNDGNYFVIIVKRAALHICTTICQQCADDFNTPDMVRAHMGNAIKTELYGASTADNIILIFINNSFSAGGQCWLLLQQRIVILHVTHDLHTRQNVFLRFQTYSDGKM